MPDLEWIAEHGRRYAHGAEPSGHRLRFVRSVLGISAAGQDDHVRAGCREPHALVLISAAAEPGPVGHIQVTAGFCRWSLSRRVPG